MDLVRTIINDRQKFVRLVFESKIPKEMKRELLLLSKRSKQDLILDVICEYFHMTYGVVPIKHERLPVPQKFIPHNFDKWYLGILREF